uniref:Uncharacterized protein n=1 Tax=Halydictyon mirabile TaxID=189652 RepID=A0A4D6WW59_9FLOR|nr:hypothetical protein [Halydictyon mirabile]
MNLDLILFYIYLTVISLFLFLISYFISIEVFPVFLFNTVLCINFKFLKKNIVNIDEKQYADLFHYYKNQKKWFIYISMLHFVASKKIINYVDIYYSLASCYANLFYNQIAEYYYLKALAYSPYNLNILNGLLKLYRLLNKYDKANKVEYKIRNIENST